MHLFFHFTSLNSVSYISSHIFNDSSHISSVFPTNLKNANLSLMCPTVDQGNWHVPLKLNSTPLPPALFMNIFQYHGGAFQHQKTLGTYLYHLHHASGFLRHTPLGLLLGLDGSWFRAGRWLGVHSPSQNLRGLRLLGSRDSDSDECHAGLPPAVQRLYTPGITEACVISYKAAPCHHQQPQAQRSPYGVWLNDLGCFPAPFGPGMLPLPIICEAAVVVII